MFSVGIRIVIMAMLYLQAESPEPDVGGLVSHTLRHASLSMLVTSLTTTAAFFGSIVSNITAIKCFRWDTVLLPTEGAAFSVDKYLVFTRLCVYEVFRL